MPAVLLVRHGQASFGADDYDVLSDLGRVQAGVMGAALRSRDLRDPHVVCGTLVRQRDTATLAGLTPDTDPRVDEYDHLGLLRRYPPAVPPTDSRGVQPALDAALAAWMVEDDDGWRTFAGGAREAVLDAVRPGRDTVVVTSGGVIAAVCSALLGVGDAAVVTLNRVVVNAAVTTLVAGRGGLTLVSFNEHGHLAREQVTYR